MCGWSPLKACNSFRTLRNAGRIRSRPCYCRGTLVVDIAKNDAGGATIARLISATSMASFTLLSKEVERLLTMAVVGVRVVVEQIRQNLQELRLTRTKKPRNPRSRNPFLGNYPSLLSASAIDPGVG
jgi:hypothetical protein